MTTTIDPEIVEILEEFCRRLRASNYDNNPWVQDDSPSHFCAADETSKAEDCRIIDCEGDTMFGEIYDVPVAKSICRLIGWLEDHGAYP